MQLHQLEIVANPHIKDVLTGRRFGRWLVESLAGQRCGKWYWNCVCDCSKKKIVSGTNLTRGKSVSCGCYHTERISLHGLSKTPEYSAWKGMKHRCYFPADESFCHYGGRGIVVCDRWRNSFENFLEDVGHRPSLDLTIGRINNDGNYSCGKCPECIRCGWLTNCRWETDEQQHNNTRVNVKVSLNGETKTIAQWARSAGIRRTTLRYRLAQGYSLEAALSSSALEPNRTRDVHGRYA